MPLPLRPRSRTAGSVDPGFFEVFLQNDRHGRVEDEVDVGRVGGVSEVTVDLFRLTIHALEPVSNVLRSLRVIARTCRAEQPGLSRGVVKKPRFFGFLKNSTKPKSPNFMFLRFF